MSYEVNAKRLGLLKEAFPGVARIALLSNPEHAGEQSELDESRKVAASLGLTIQYVPVRSTEEFERAFTAIANEGSSSYRRHGTLRRFSRLQLSTRRFSSFWTKRVPLQGLVRPGRPPPHNKR